MTRLECQNCKRRWDYTGDREYYATCPDCKASVHIERQRVDDFGDDTSG